MLCCVCGACAGVRDQHRTHTESRGVMSADVWFKRDIANALLATWQACDDTAVSVGSADSQRAAAFRAGLRTGIATMALYFGISPGPVLPEVRSGD